MEPEWEPGWEPDWELGCKPEWEPKWDQSGTKLDLIWVYSGVQFGSILSSNLDPFWVHFEVQFRSILVSIWDRHLTGTEPAPMGHRGGPGTQKVLKVWAGSSKTGVTIWSRLLVGTRFWDLLRDSLKDPIRTL